MGDDSPSTRQSLLENLAGPGERWDEFDRTYRPVMVAMARQIGLDHHDAQDAVQEAFGTLQHSLQDFHHNGHVGSFRRYLRRVVRSRALDWVRRSPGARRQEPIETAPESAMVHTSVGDSLETKLGERDFAEAVDRAMAVLVRQLRNRDRAVLEHYYLKEWPAERVATAFRLTEANVHQIARRHKLALYREVLTQLNR
jgi:RNA polymerase sigma factor (sigma-70 family)